MQTVTIEKIMAETETLLPEEQLRLAAHLIEKAMSHLEKKEPSRRQWKEIAGIAPNLMQGQDAQEWISNSRRESDAHREKALRK